MIMRTEKSHYLPSANWKPKKASSIIQCKSQEGLRAAAARAAEEAAAEEKAATAAEEKAAAGTEAGWGGGGETEQP